MNLPGHKGCLHCSHFRDGYAGKTRIELRAEALVDTDRLVAHPP